MKKNISHFVLVCILLTGTLYGQLQLTGLSNSPTLNQDIQNIFAGGGVTISNAVYYGGTAPTTQIATFTNPVGSSHVGDMFNSGLVLTTGSYNQAGIDQCYNCNHHIFVTDPLSNDPDLVQLNGGTGVHSYSILEFDVVPSGNLLQFQYIWASEEYPGYANPSSPFNDKMGLFISGPSISGTFSNGAENIALIGSQYVGIQTVNNGWDANCAGPCNNCSFFICNYETFYPSFYNPHFVYNGYTRTLTAQRAVECGETYHIKLAICNVADQLLDAAVFFKANTLMSDFTAGPATALPNPVCQGQPVTLNCTGDATFTYNWYNSSNVFLGSGQTINVTANPTDPPYTVEVINTLTGCTLDLENSTNTIIHTSSNVCPTTQGINNTNEYTYYIQAGQPINFDIFSFDALNENITMSITGLPAGLNSVITPILVPPYNVDHPKAAIFGTLFSLGEYTFQVKLTDNNVCGSYNCTYNFKIKVVCPDCLIDQYYEKKGGANPALPGYTERIHWIVAGTSVDPSQTDGPVLVNASQNVTFKAGAAIKLEPGFYAQTNSVFLAQIAEPDCNLDCRNDCCEAWSGLTVTQSEMPNIFTPNGDNVNDYWYLPDTDHPYCAFNITGFWLSVYDRWGVLIHEQTGNSNICCAFNAPASGVATGHSSIWWDGRVNLPTPGGPYVTAGQYRVVLTLYGCNNYEVTWETEVYVYP
jgi:gliding motility-associated-like protein